MIVKIAVWAFQLHIHAQIHIFIITVVDLARSLLPLEATKTKVGAIRVNKTDWKSISSPSKLT